jgi:hypothetical protein
MIYKMRMLGQSSKIGVWDGLRTGVDNTWIWLGIILLISAIGGQECRRIGWHDMVRQQRLWVLMGMKSHSILGYFVLLLRPLSQAKQWSKISKPLACSDGWTKVALSWAPVIQESKLHKSKGEKFMPPVVVWSQTQVQTWTWMDGTQVQSEVQMVKRTGSNVLFRVQTCLNLRRHPGRVVL